MKTLSSYTFFSLFLFISLSFQETSPPQTIDKLVERGESFLEISEYDSALVYLDLAKKEFDLTIKENFTSSSALLFLNIQNNRCDAIARMGNRKEGIRIAGSSLDKVLPYLNGEEVEIAENYHHRGVLYRLLRELPTAEAFLLKAEPLYKKHENFPALVRLTNELAKVAYNKYDYPQTKTYGQAALELAKSKLEKDHYELVGVTNQLGNLYTDIDKMEEGYKYYLEGLRILKKHREEPHNFFGMLYDNLARYHRIAGNWDSVQHYGTLTLNNDRHVFGELHEYVADGYARVGMAHRMQRQLTFARDHFEKALAIRIEVLGEIHNRVADNYMDLGLVSNNLGEHEKALTNYKKALPIYLKTLGEKNENIGVCYQNIGDIQLQKGAYQTAFEYYNKALQLFKTIKHEQREQSAYISLGMGYFKKKEVTKGKEYFLKAIEGYRKIYPEKNARIANVYKELSQHLKENEIYEEALKYSHAAINELTLGEEIANFQQSISLEGAYLAEEVLYHCVSEKAEILHKMSIRKNDPQLKQAAHQHYLVAIDLLYNTFRNVKRSTDKRTMIKEAIRVFEGGIGTSVHSSNNSLTAFELSERYKSILLLQSIREAEAMSTANFPIEMIHQINSSKSKITDYEKLLFEQTNELKQTDNLKIAELKANIFDLRSTLDSLNRTLENSYPKYYNSKYNDEVATIESIQANLTQEQALLEYFVGDSAIYAFTISKDNYQTHKIKKDFPLERLVKQLQNSAYTYHLSGSRSDKILQTYADSLMSASYELYNKIFAPIVAASNLPKQLIIVPDGVLGYVPFELLVSETPENSILFGAHRYLLHDYQISYTYSATLLQEMQQKEHASTKGDFLAFAPSFEQKVVYADANRSVDAVRGSLNALTYNTPEVEALQKMIGGEIFTGSLATEHNFKKNAPDYKILHLATHGKANDNIGDYAYLAFTEIEDATENELLYNRDLYNMQLNADMVVLSACETGIGELQRGEGIISLARGFSYAGAKSIITTLWSVNDQKTKELMGSFYRYIQKGDTKDAALRQAKLDFLQKYSHEAHPFFWASFVPVGDMTAIELKKSVSWWGYSIIAIFSVSLLYFLYSRTNR